MLVLVIISLIITSNVYADSYTTNNTIVPSQYHDFFQLHFKNKNYKYFPYNCLTSSSYYRTCYMGIDKDGNYIKISYNNNNELEITKGIDNNFSLNGDNYFEIKDVNYQFIISILICIFLLIFMIGGIL